MPRYGRILLKVSGEALGGDAGSGFDKASIQMMASEVKDVCDAGVELALVVGAGNFVRGADAADMGIERATVDYMGMTATILNALALQSAIEALGYSTRVLSAIEADQVVEPYIRRRAQRHMEKGRVIILAGGTGNPYCTTDSAAALRAIELDCKAILKATKVDGIYTADPLKHPDAKKYDRVSYEQAIREHLKIMDANAFTMCEEHHIPIIVYSMKTPGNTIKAARGEHVGTLVDRD